MKARRPESGWPIRNMDGRIPTAAADAGSGAPSPSPLWEPTAHAFAGAQAWLRWWLSPSVEVCVARRLHPVRLHESFYRGRYKLSASCSKRCIGTGSGSPAGIRSSGKVEATIGPVPPRICCCRPKPSKPGKTYLGSLLSYITVIPDLSPTSPEPPASPVA